MHCLTSVVVGEVERRDFPYRAGRPGLVLSQQHLSRHFRRGDHDRGNGTQAKQENIAEPMGPVLHGEVWLLPQQRQVADDGPSSRRRWRLVEPLVQSPKHQGQKQYGDQRRPEREHFLVLFVTAMSRCGVEESQKASNRSPEEPHGAELGSVHQLICFV